MKNFTREGGLRGVPVDTSVRLRAHGKPVIHIFTKLRNKKGRLTTVNAEKTAKLLAKNANIVSKATMIGTYGTRSSRRYLINLNS